MQNMSKILAIFNLLAVIGVISWNYYTTIYGFQGNEVGKVSDELINLFTPAGYAFSIWGLIFLALLVQGFQVLKCSFDQQYDEMIRKITPSFIVANILNCVWVVVWLGLLPGVSTIVMSGILIALIFTALSVDRTVLPKNRFIRITIEFPVRLYLGWIIVAIVANYAAYLNTTSFSSFIGETPWFYIMSAIATGIMVLVTWQKSWYEIPAVGIWAFTAIAVRHWNDKPILSYVIIACIIVLICAILSRMLNKKTQEVSIA